MGRGRAPGRLLRARAAGVGLGGGSDRGRGGGRLRGGPGTRSAWARGRRAGAPAAAARTARRSGIRHLQLTPKNFATHSVVKFFYLTVSVPFIPACSWPGTEQKKVYLPGFRL